MCESSVESSGNPIHDSSEKDSALLSRFFLFLNESDTAFKESRSNTLAHLSPTAALDWQDHPMRYLSVFDSLLLFPNKEYLSVESTLWNNNFYVFLEI